MKTEPRPYPDHISGTFMDKSKLPQYILDKMKKNQEDAKLEKKINMTTQLEDLLTKHPALVFDDGLFFSDMEQWGEDIALTVKEGSHVLLNAELIIDDHYEGFDIVDNDTKDPQEEITVQASGSEYVRTKFNGSYKKALESAKP